MTQQPRPAQGNFEDVLAQFSHGESHSKPEELWPRTPLTLDPSKDSLCFQNVDIRTHHNDVQDPKTGKTIPTLLLFGVTETGNSVLCHVHGFRPYMYAAVPPGLTKNDCHPLKLALEQHKSLEEGAIHSVTWELRHSLLHYKGATLHPFFKVTATSTRHITTLRKIFEEGDIGVPGQERFPRRETYESNLVFTLRFMIDKGLKGMAWVEIPQGKYALRNVTNKSSRCQVECDVNEHDLIAHEPDGEWSKMAPLRILSFDIECKGRKGVFPEANVDPVIMIANAVSISGEDKSFIRNVFTLGSCASIVGVDVRSCSSESQMLMEWKAFVDEVDPDVMTGYNTLNFDFPYLLDRAKHLNATSFPFLSRQVDIMTQAKSGQFSSRQAGTREQKAVELEGRVNMDLFQTVQRDFKLRSYSLNNVSAHFLGEQKEAVHHSIISDLFNGNDESRKRLAVYCFKDAYLPQRLLMKLMTVVNYSEMARVTGVPMNDLLARGQQIKVISQLYRKAGDMNFVIPATERGSVVGDGEVGYEGATVIEPERGYYEDPIATLDFSSLYPSIMMAHNLCYSTLIKPATIERLNLVCDRDYSKTPNGDHFVKPCVRKGLLASVLEDLLSARKQAKADLKKEKDPSKKAILDGRQLALKISANSVYGFTGATVGKLPCLEISSSVTAYGREMIQETKRLVQEKFRRANGYENDSQVIYGDTDSVMVKFGVDLEKSMELGKEAAEYVTQRFIKPIKLEFEKAYFPFLLISKKRYAGLYWTNPSKYDKLDSKGIETVRRDSAPLVSRMVDVSLKRMLIDRDVEGAVQFVKYQISELLQNRVDTGQLVMSKQLAKEYSGKQPHAELAERMRKRDPGTAPHVGDRVPFVIVKGRPDQPMSDRAEHPLYVLEKNIPIDTKYYLENQLMNPLIRIFEPILREKTKEKLFSGAHTTTIQISAPKVGGLMKFATKTQTCLGCRGGVKSGAVCPSCVSRGRYLQLYCKQLNRVNELEVRYGRLWTQCQRCQGNLHQDVLCTNGDCPIFYMRKKAQVDLGETWSQLERFGLLEW